MQPAARFSDSPKISCRRFCSFGVLTGQYDVGPVDSLCAGPRLWRSWMTVALRWTTMPPNPTATNAWLDSTPPALPQYGLGQTVTIILARPVHSRVNTERLYSKDTDTLLNAEPASRTSRVRYCFDGSQSRVEMLIAFPHSIGIEVAK